MKSVVRKVEELVIAMESITIEVGLEPEIFNKSKVIDPAMGDDEIADRLTFLQDVYDRQFSEVVNVKRLLSPEIWAQYKAFGVTGLREQKLLKSAIRALKKVWRAKYGPTKKQTTEQDGNQKHLETE